jgi:hypothetical protein
MNTHKIHGILLAALGFVSASLVIGGCACCGDCDAEKTKGEEHASIVKVVNDICPIGKDPIDSSAVDASLTRQWHGKSIGFCCDGCPQMWDDMSEADREKSLAAVMPR